MLLSREVPPFLGFEGLCYQVISQVTTKRARTHVGVVSVHATRVEARGEGHAGLEGGAPGGSADSIEHVGGHG